MAVMEAIIAINSPIIRQAGIALEMTAARLQEIRPLMIIATQQEIVIKLIAITRIATIHTATIAIALRLTMKKTTRHQTRQVVRAILSTIRPAVPTAKTIRVIQLTVRLTIRVAILQKALLIMKAILATIRLIVRAIRAKVILTKRVTITVIAPLIPLKIHLKVRAITQRRMRAIPLRVLQIMRVTPATIRPIVKVALTKVRQMMRVTLTKVRRITKATPTKALLATIAKQLKVRITVKVAILLTM